MFVNFPLYLSVPAGDSSIPLVPILLAVAAVAAIALLVVLSLKKPTSQTPPSEKPPASDSTDFDSPS